MADPSDVLSYAVRPRVILKYLGQLGFVLALLSVVPMGVSLLTGSLEDALKWTLVLGVLLTLAIPAAWQSTPRYIQTNEALTVIALAFLLSPVLLAYPLTSGDLTPTDALFESISAITTTGLTTLSSVEGQAQTFLFDRAWMQWCGGLGFVVLLVALLMGNETAARRLTTPYGSETILTTARTHARRMLGVYLTLTILGLAIVWAASGTPFNAVIHVLTAVSTGGFSSFDQSLGGIESWLTRYTLIGTAVMGAIPLPLYLYFRRLRPTFLGDTELRALIVALVLVGTALTVLFHYQSGFRWGEALRHGFLMGASAQTTTGFSTLDPADTGAAAQVVMILAMFVGGGLGSTAGGIKLLRLMLVLELVRTAIRRTTLPPHAVAAEVRLGDHTVAPDDIQHALVLVILYLGVTLTSWLFFLVYGYPPLGALFEVVSAVGTVGLSSGITSHDLPLLLKGVLGVDMLLGRLEIVALLVLLYPRNWLGNRVD